jgi:hypothetical protein
MRAGEEEVNIVRETWSRQAALADLEVVAQDGDAIVGYVLAAVGFRQPTTRVTSRIAARMTSPDPPAVR